MKKLAVTPIKCVGCRLCELTCSFGHHGILSHDIPNLHIVTFEDKADSTPYVCVQCQERSCVEVCPVEALSVNELTGAIDIDRDACVQCGLCVNACQHGGIRFITLNGDQQIAVCDLCKGSPRCAKVCREHALSYE